MHAFWLVTAKPLILFVFGLLVIGIAKTLNRLIPEGPAKRFLFKPRGVNAARTVPPEEQASVPHSTPEAARLAYKASRHR